MNTPKLISSVQQKPALWDKSHKMYHNRDYTRDLWYEVCMELELEKSDIETVKKRWNSLRDVFRREMYKYEESKNSVSTWVHYSSMLFLASQMRKTNTQPIEFTNPEIMICNYENDSQNDINNITMKGVKRRQSEEIDPFEEIESHSKKKQLTVYADDDQSDYHFLMSLLPFLKSIPYDRKLSVRMKLQQILAEQQPENQTQCSNANSPLENISIIPSPTYNHGR